MSLKATTLTHLKNATRDIERSSIAVLDDAKMLLSTPGVTGMRPLDDGGPSGTLAYERFSSDELVDDAGISTENLAHEVYKMRRKDFKVGK